MEFQNDRRLKILFLASWYPNIENPVNGIFIKRHALAASRYCDVAVLYVHIGYIDKDIELIEDDGILQVSVYRKLSLNPNKVIRYISNNIIQYWGYLLCAINGYKLILERFGKPDLVHCNVILYAGLFALYLKFRNNIQYIITEHWTGYIAESNVFNDWAFFIKSLTRIIGRNAAAITTVSNSLRDAMIKCKIDNDYFVIPNVAEVLADNDHSKNQKNIKQILHISLLNDNIKNVSGIISAVRDLYLRRKDFELHIVGSGIDQRRLQSLAEDYGLLNKVVFFEGTIDENELSRFLFECDFFVLNSNYETFSVVTAEALSCGKPVIATRCGGPEEFVNEKCGILIEPKDSDALIKAMDYMLDNYSIYNSEEIKEYARSRFGYDAIGKGFLKIYRKVLR